MNTGNPNTEQLWRKYYGPNLGYVQEQYERYAIDPESVDASFRELFQRLGAPPALEQAPEQERLTAPDRSAGQTIDPQLLHKAVAAGKLVWNIRTYGHLAADIDPLRLGAAANTRLLEPETFGLSRQDLLALPASLIWENAPEDVATGWDAIERLRRTYTQSTAYEFSHVHEERERDWLNKSVEKGAAVSEALTGEERIALLNRLIQTEQFESFLHKTFVGQKRFSVEGNDALIPMLDELVRSVARQGGKHVLMGMAHRGRLNVLAHVLGKPYGKIFAEFHHSPNRDLVPSEGSIGINYGWTGDVKYHLGADRSVEESEGNKIRLTLANNPSHLEFVNPVVEGFTRAAQEDRTSRGSPVQDESIAAAVIMHGDAAFAGEGIVPETLNFNRLPGYRNGGTVHIIVNNRIGFTTESHDARSTYYASDLAKGFEIPIVHVNADDPDACIAAIRMACEFREKFKKDFLIDLIGYRRYGHNESDDPDTTQPLIYEAVRNHQTVATLYAYKLIAEGVLSETQVEAMKRESLASLQEAYEEMLGSGDKDAGGKRGSVTVVREEAAQPPVTAVPLEQLRDINAELLKRPDSFRTYPKLQRILERRAKALDEGEKVDWALAETLAFATILADGKPIRISGQDSQRGTFAHRNLVLHDSTTGDTFCPLHALPQAKASFAIHNSPLSEASVLGFEYGYNVFAPETFVIWEAQYGDFANAGQVIIDQFLAAGRGKWRQKSSLTLLLPHGYEGQGPEHSSARLERYLQLAGEDNWTVVNLTRASQYFHLLRRQAAWTESEEARPLIVMAPKSLIRNPRVASPGTELSGGQFQPILEQPGLGAQPARVERLVLCCGKVAVDLEEAIQADGSADWSWLHIVRTEQLYPFPAKEIEAVIRRFPNVREIVWMQEEPRNMGAWSFMEPRIRELAPEGVIVRYVGRRERSSTASGYQNVHSFEQRQLLANAMDRNFFQTERLGGAVHV
ncbi:2-oxoglutarate dehydrogenase E1 component [Paenibacillus mesophilus]|uniref:2-oxoglutarate dehydrogenase E1 component n=1 Tax=Paenibacillus mesophilus TaxID=2582849 RepID=UPI00110E8866|nr:2-oxoglutarate dehydrogenase E1 component [Paenibacillus mesophilus]TMV46934.1 2-oxoglutarate dehydrogenase E1 component [Paenibacillus mesophilus]